MKKYLLIPAAVLYAIGAGCLLWYCLYSFNTDIVVTPAFRLVILGGVCLSVYFGSLLLSVRAKEQTAQRIMKGTLIFFFGLYLMLLVTLVLFDSYFGRVGLGNTAGWTAENFSAYLQESLSIIPFRTTWAFISGVFKGWVDLDTAVTNIVGNLVAFAPFAFFLPLLFKSQRRFPIFLLTMVCMVVAVELSQLLLLTGFCDIDDLILNVGGACILYALLRIKSVSKLINKITKIE